MNFSLENKHDFLYREIIFDTLLSPMLQNEVKFILTRCLK